MWQRFFCFPIDVAQTLTKLTTFNGFLPQGAATSSYIANLIFWDKEPDIEHNLRERDVYYSRYVDDITVSTNRKLSKQERGDIKSLVYGMLLRANVKPNREKRKVYFRGGKMLVHGLNVDRKKPTMRKKREGILRQQ